MIETPFARIASRPREGEVREPDGASDRALLAGYPPADGPEVDVLRVRPSMARSSPILWVSVWLLGIVGAIGVVWLLARSRPAWLLIFPASAVVGAACTLLSWKLRCMSSEVRITTKRLIDRDGLLGRRITEVLHRDIKRVDLRQTLWQRLCGVGELSICADADDGPEVFMAHLPNPDRVRAVLDLYRSL
jgi:hypothetical protein